jgi:hypothetical protein
MLYALAIVPSRAVRDMHRDFYSTVHAKVFDTNM